MSVLFCLLIFQAGGSFAQGRAFVISSFPRNHAEDLSCQPVLSLQLHFAEASRTLDPLTVNTDNIRLYEENGDGMSLPSEVVFREETRVLSLRPRSRLKPMTQYILSITAGLVDDRGFSLRPFFIRFRTGDCGSGTQPYLAMRGEEAAVPAGPAVILKTDSLERQEELNRLKWVTFGERMIASYVILRKTDTCDWTIVAEMTCPGDNDSLQTYMWTDPLPSYGWNRYTIAAVTVMGDTLYLDTLHQFRKQVTFPKQEIFWKTPFVVVTWLEARTPMVAILRDRAGNIVKKEAGWAKGGRQSWPLSFDEVSPGAYMLQLFLGNESYHTPVLIKL